MENIRFVGRDLHRTTYTLKDMYEYCSSKSLLGLDIETSAKFKRGTYNENIYKGGLDPYLSRICMIQIGDLETQFVIDAREFSKEELSKWLKPMLENKKIKKVIHNAKFEGKFFKHCLDIEILNVWDTMICERILYNGYLHSYSLKALMGRYLGAKGVEELSLFNSDSFFDDEVDMYVDKSTRMQFVNWGDKPFTSQQILYAVDDIIAPLRIYKEQIKGRIIDGEVWNPKLAFKLENKFTQILAYIELVGMPIDTIKWLELYKKNHKDYLCKLNFLNDYVINNHLDFTDSVNLFSNKAECAIQWSSSKQVINFFRKLGFCPKEKSKQTKKLEWTVGAKALFKLLDNTYKLKYYSSKFPEKIENNSDLILAYLLYKQSEQLSTTFGKDWLKYVHPITKRVHTSFNQFMNTGRLSSTSPNLQNLPGIKEFRDCFTNGEYYINADFSGQESRVLAYITKVPALVEFYTKGHPIFGSDLHSYAATAMYRALLKDPDLIVTKKTDKEKRNNAKAFNFKLSYGGSAWTIKDEIGKSIEETQELLKAYFEGFPGLEQEFESAKKDVLKKGWIQLCPKTDKRYFYPFYKRMKQIEDEAYLLTDYEKGKKIPEEEKIRLRKETNWSALWREWGTYKGELERRKLNYRIQGSAASQIKLAAILFYKDKTHPNQVIMNVIHDEILAICPQSLLEETKILLEESMRLGGNTITPTINMPAEGVISKVWEH